MMRDNPFEHLFSSKEISQDPIKLVHGVQIDFRRIKDGRYVLKKLYQIISNPDRAPDATSLQWRVGIVGYLEKLLRTTFKNTRDFRRKSEGYLNGYEVRKRPVSERIRKARKKKKWTQKQLADHLGYKTHVSIAQYEKGLRYPPAKVFRWLEEQGM